MITPAAETTLMGNGSKTGGKSPMDRYGILTFDKRVMSRRLSKSVYEKLTDTIDNNTQLDM